MAGPSVPPGYSSPFATVTEDDHAAWIIITTVLGLVYTIIFGVVRAFIGWTTGGGYMHQDDVAFAVSTILTIVQCSVVLGACSHGLGKVWANIPQSSHETVQQIYYASFLLFVLALGLSKISVVCFQARLVAASRQRKVFQGVVLLIAAWTGASLLALALQYNLSSPWRLVGRECSDAGIRWIVISVFDILIEVAIASLAGYLVWNLQMTKARKWTVFSAFAYRLTLIVPIALRLLTHDPSGLSTDPTFREVLFVVWTQVEMHLSLIFATTPILRPVIKNMNTSYSSLGPAASSAGYETSSGTYKLSVLKKTSSHAAEREAAPYGDNVGSTSRANATAFAFASSSTHHRKMEEEAIPDTHSIESQSSERMIIRKQVSWRVEQDTASRSETT